jgi:tRNA(Ile2) C34 agmatinyltransferase TiaS
MHDIVPLEEPTLRQLPPSEDEPACRACGWTLANDGTCPRCNYEVDVALWHLAQVPVYD